MRKVPETPFPLSAWPHAVVQLVAYLTVLRAIHWEPAVVQTLGRIEGNSHWYWAIAMWLVFGLLLGEFAVRRCQELGFGLFPKHVAGFRIVTFIGTILALHTLFVLLESLLLWMGALLNPVTIEKIAFGKAFLTNWLQDAGLLLVFAVGEFLRQLMYRNSMRNWHVTRRKRKDWVAPIDEEFR